MGNAEILYSQLAEHQADSRRVAMILQTAGRGADLVRQLLAFSRKQELVSVPVDLNKAVRGMGDLLRATLGRTIRTEMQLGADLWPALIDPVQIEHVILNLAINARDAMPEGGTLTIVTANRTLHRHDDKMDLPAGDYVVVSVGDTGTGMSEEVLHNAFEPFFTTKPPGQGSGLGLSQVYGVASQSGGSVWIDSTLGKGTVVSVLLPRARDAETQGGAGQRVAALRSDPAGCCGRILVVDDDPECRATVASVLEDNGFSVTAAQTAKQALRLADEGLEFDLLLVDFAMPDMNGAELAEEMRARRPSLPVVFLAVGDGEWVSGERWVLRKPLAGRSLIETLHAALGHQRETAASRSAQKV
jgi:CheY-like chemotaxis protein